MPEWKIDSSEDVIGVVIMVVMLAAILAGVIIYIISKKGHIKAGPVEVGDDDAVPLAQSDCPDPCVPYVAEHSAILEELKKNVALLTSIQQSMLREMGGLDMMQRAQNGALDVLLGIAAGETPNGQVDRARVDLAKAQGYKDGAKA